MNAYELRRNLDNFAIALREMKPNDRSELDRDFSICITEAEKLDAYFNWRIMPFIKEEE